MYWCNVLFDVDPSVICRIMLKTIFFLFQQTNKETSKQNKSGPRLFQFIFVPLREEDRLGIKGSVQCTFNCNKMDTMTRVRPVREAARNSFFLRAAHGFCSQFTPVHLPPVYASPQT